MTKRDRINLGIAIAHSKFRRKLTHREIAAFCGCTWANIWLIEQKAIHKLKRSAFMHEKENLTSLRCEIGKP